MMMAALCSLLVVRALNKAARDAPKTLPLCSSPCLSYLCVRVQHNSKLFLHALGLVDV